MTCQSIKEDQHVLDTWEDIEKAFKAESEAIEAEPTEEERKAVAAKLQQKLADPEYAKLLKELEDDDEVEDQTVSNESEVSPPSPKNKKNRRC